MVGDVIQVILIMGETVDDVWLCVSLRVKSSHYYLCVYLFNRLSCLDYGLIVGNIQLW